MYTASSIAQTGPMAAVAGALAEILGREILNAFTLQELVIENGGDLFLYTKEELAIRVLAAFSTLSGKLAIRLPAVDGAGLACSSGTAGPSFSLGRADAAIVFDRNAALADARATALGNQITRKEDIQAVLDAWQKIQPSPEGLVVIKEDSLGAWGNLSLMPIMDTN